MKILRAEAEGETEGYRKLHNKEHHSGLSSRNIRGDTVKEDNLGEKCTHQKSRVLKISVRKHEV
jgi:hypothetical protein